MWKNCCARRSARPARLRSSRRKIMARDSKDIIRQRVHKRIRRKLSGSPERPRLAVFRSLNHIYAQVIDDTRGHTLVMASSNEKNGVNGGNVAGAKAIGKLVAE